MIESLTSWVTELGRKTGKSIYVHERGFIGPCKGWILHLTRKFTPQYFHHVLPLPPALNLAVLARISSTVLGHTLAENKNSP